MVVFVLQNGVLMHGNGLFVLGNGGVLCLCRRSDYRAFLESSTGTPTLPLGRCEI